MDAATTYIVPVISTDSAPLLQAHDLHHRYGGRSILAGLHLTAEPGQCHVILGHNGVGKTTLLRILAGLVRPRRGAVSLSGTPIRSDPAIRERIGMVGHQTQLYGDLTVRENLDLAADLFGCPRTLIDAMVTALRLEGCLDMQVRRLSRGTAQRVAIARALHHGPDLLLLDEPMTGLDVEATEWVRDLLADRLAAGTAVIVVTHHFDEFWPIATHVSVLRAGTWLFQGPANGSIEEMESMIRQAGGSAA